MAYKFANDNEPYDGPTHEFLGVLYSGATRTPSSRRLIEVPSFSQQEPKEVKPRKPRGKQPPKPKGATAWD